MVGGMKKSRAKIDDEGLFRELWEGGVATKEIAGRFGVTGPSVTRAARRLGFPARVHLRGIGKAVLSEDGSGPEGPAKPLSARRPDPVHALPTDFWTAAKDVLVFQTQGRYAAVNALARRLGVAPARIVARWHLVRAR